MPQHQGAPGGIGHVPSGPQPLCHQDDVGMQPPPNMQRCCERAAQQQRCDQRGRHVWHRRRAKAGARRERLRWLLVLVVVLVVVLVLVVAGSRPGPPTVAHTLQLPPDQQLEAKVERAHEHAMQLHQSPNTLTCTYTQLDVRRRMAQLQAQTRRRTSLCDWGWGRASHSSYNCALFIKSHTALVPHVACIIAP